MSLTKVEGTEKYTILSDDAAKVFKAGLDALHPNQTPGVPIPGGHFLMENNSGICCQTGGQGIITLTFTETNS